MKWHLAGVFALFVLFVLSSSPRPPLADAEPPTDEDGFVSIFDGKSFDGWNGDTKGHTIEDGVLICTKKGKFLYSDKEYADFHLKFQFKLTPGANNGLCIRAPRKGNPAFDGMELQILDDTAEKYKNLKPYQFHGSVYGIVPAKPGHLKPVGEWNSQEVICRGSRVVVKLNGTTIVDADVKKSSSPTALDGRDHPCVDRTQGHLVLFGHGARVEFRDLKIKEL